MVNPEEETWRVILNWLIPSAFAISIIKVATKMLSKDISWTGAILTTIISVMTGVVVGSIVFFALFQHDAVYNVSAMWKALAATSVASLMGERLGHYFIYDFEIDKAFNEIMGSIVERIKKLLE